MINLPNSFLWICLSITLTSCQKLPFGSYHNEIRFPAIRGEFHSSTQESNDEPIRQISAGFHLNPPPPLPFLQSFPLNPLLLPAARNFMRESKDMYRSRGFQAPPLFNLFTPNTIRQRPESLGQIEEYRKALKEEAEENEKQQNEITTNIEGTSSEPTSKTYVNVNVKGQEYSYST